METCLNMAFTVDGSLHRPGLDGSVDELLDELARVKAVVESARKGAGLRLRLLAALQRLEGASQRGLDVPEQVVDPLAFGHGACGRRGLKVRSTARELRFTAVAHGGLMRTAVTWAAGAQRPARGLRRVGAPCLGSDEAAQFGDRRAVPERERLPVGRGVLTVEAAQMSESAAAAVSEAEEGFRRGHRE